MGLVVCLPQRLFTHARTFVCLPNDALVDLLLRLRLPVGRLLGVVPFRVHRLKLGQLRVEGLCIPIKKRACLPMLLVL